MFLLDTNVISELRRLDKADRNVVAWASMIPASRIFLSVISILEIELGALLRQEGLYSSHLITWRQQRTAGLTPASWTA